jgi:hypothetical protein
MGFIYDEITGSVMQQGKRIMRTNTTLAKSFICPCSLGQPAMWAISLSFPRKIFFFEQGEGPEGPSCINSVGGSTSYRGTQKKKEITKQSSNMRERTLERLQEKNSDLSSPP